ncbi:MAG: ATP synthase subunit I [Armatimonadetes bacterium]|nr:ATP synthase subunit I [Armatimonadota bacterium]
MTDVLWIILALAAGFAFGWAYFAALWATVRRLPTARHPALLSVLSLATRLGAAVGFLYLIGAGDWRRLLAAGAGFTAARMLSIRGRKEVPKGLAGDGGLAP